MEGRKLIAIYSSSNDTEHNGCGTHIGAFYAPTNPIPVKAYTDTCTKLKHTVIALIRLNIAPDGTTAGKKGQAILMKAEKQVYKLLDELLGYEGAAQSFFNTIRPFAKVKGKFYCEQCLHMVKQYVDFGGSTK